MVMRFLKIPILFKRMAREWSKNQSRSCLICNWTAGRVWKEDCSFLSPWQPSYFTWKCLQTWRNSHIKVLPSFLMHHIFCKHLYQHLIIEGLNDKDNKNINNTVSGKQPN